MAEPPPQTSSEALADVSLPQHQGALDDQLDELVWAANRLGLYDAVDWINRTRRRTDDG